jgi:hypothetical protein
VLVPAEIVALLASPLHAYEGRPADGPTIDPSDGARDRIEIRAGQASSATATPVTPRTALLR